MYQKHNHKKTAKKWKLPWCQITGNSTSDNRIDISTALGFQWRVCLFNYIYIYTYIHTYMHAYIHTYIHTHIHTYTCIISRYQQTIAKGIWGWFIYNERSLSTFCDCDGSVHCMIHIEYCGNGCWLTCIVFKIHHVCWWGLFTCLRCIFGIKVAILITVNNLVYVDASI